MLIKNVVYTFDYEGLTHRSLQLLRETRKTIIKVILIRLPAMKKNSLQTNRFYQRENEDKNLAHVGSASSNRTNTMLHNTQADLALAQKMNQITQNISRKTHKGVSDICFLEHSKLAQIGNFEKDVWRKILGISLIKFWKSISYTFMLMG